MRLDDSIQFIKGVGPRRAKLLRDAGIRTIEDLLLHLPFRYEDRRRILTVKDARYGEEGTFAGRISGVRELRPRGRRSRSVLHAVFSDDSGWLNLVWFHQAAYFKKKLESGSLWLIYGKVEAARRGGLEIVHPDIEVLEGAPAASPAAADLPVSSEFTGAVARIVPVYQKPGELSVAAMRQLTAAAVEKTVAQMQSIVPDELRDRLGLLPLRESLEFVHAPPESADIAALNGFDSDAHHTLIFEELFALQVGIAARKKERSLSPGVGMPAVPRRIDAWIAGLPFDPTRAQRRVIDEVSTDMAEAKAMTRLVQGDVGSGKTVVAFAALLQAIAAGYQAAFMAPTGLLAEQHCATMRPWCEAEGLCFELLVGGMPAAEMRRVRRAAAEGEVDLVVGTHALIQEGTEFAKLGLAVIDEQHRFGVLQRAALKGEGADTLLLSATPIPRTLSLVLFGDIEVSLLDELPPGRKPVTTRVLRSQARPRLYERMAASMRRGRQCYIVYPLVEESEKMDLSDASSMAEELQSGPFADYRVGLIHGRMKSDEKDAVMRRFRAGELHCLVATTVIEVGIDVPNATIMVIEHAERFGLAQLHQLRGRVGRGSEEAFCCLVADPGLSPEAFERLRIMETTGDGFEVAEADLRLRGPGEYLGTRQSGIPALRAANLVRDAKLLETARREALAWLERDPGLTQPRSQELRRAVERRWGDKLSLAVVG